ncbi:MAG TPA: hypothetical protein VKH37_04000 [Ferruginibacter sp.]|nr:hypothetical protein [Ferruginibacter sp.]
MKQIILALAIFSFAAGCSKSNDTVVPAVTTPVVSTVTATSITQTTAASGGAVISDGGAPVTARGVTWSSTNSSPTVGVVGSYSIDGSGTGPFSSSLTGLSANTTYYYRAYATNSAGTNYGGTGSFTTLP